ncbi:aminotransferase class I/II-fold pyridoxal phosphate-dependent enzyme [Catenulispora yoronensis]|uniref:Aminotransferase class I/II-fold pyridoxal phosphate-dependent enzyme n=2 Tax=Catenulispora yoronensis TaxID=450799 RepID=A0ABP5FFX1_9ACTN
MSIEVPVPVAVREAAEGAEATEATEPVGLADRQPLSLTEEEMSRAGRRAIDVIVERLQAGANGPVLVRGRREDLERVWREPLPEQGDDLVALLDRLARDRTGLGVGMHSDHPRCFSFVPCAGNFPAVLADALVAAFLSVPGAWLVGAGPTQIELTTLAWLRELLGLGPDTSGLFVSGGSVATLTALTAARDHRLDGVLAGARAYSTTQAHPSVARALHILGLNRDQLIALEPDAGLRMDPAVLADRVRRDRAAGLRPFLVVATAGTTSTGAIDPLADLAALCEQEGLWLHVDGAFGAAAAITARGRAVLAGLDLADSITLDPHKWLFQPYEIGCVLLRRPELLKESFGLARHFLDTGYLAVTESGGEPVSSSNPGPTPGLKAVPDAAEVNLSDYGPQQTRGLRALKLWLSLKTFGAAAFREAVERGMELADHAGALVEAQPELELTSSPQLGIFTFRFRPSGMERGATLDAFQSAVSNAVLDAGYAMVTTTQVRGETVLRMCTINPRTDSVQVEKTLDHVVQIGRSLAVLRAGTGPTG